MEKIQADVLGGYDEFELVEMGEADVYGGTTWSCAIVTAVATLVSASACPTTKCTSQC
ncbi:class II lanthipeptide, LchA2/BrtA2 family [Streptomyces wedmorensis]|uniref:class II lanthipeptide, LchA2/BrtA2 family n=1 Tax=Streptomyces TaxID=1883 RepID=UPI0002FF951C|nr:MULTISPECIES: class II lanthipeptide, LchA2/BrtA2 family [Streptomyces]